MSFYETDPDLRVATWLNRWRLTRDVWEQRRRDDIQIHNLEACHALLPLS
ncbi:hypothetical protein GCM10009789_06080 [Kribbella sancticallisti]|uniref:Uncharacterized protein n=1 Tax=Kribbella sancticallisti TaxID=460087 RepID=A0ABN2CBP4_9ACTN